MVRGARMQASMDGVGAGAERLLLLYKQQAEMEQGILGLT